MRVDAPNQSRNANDDSPISSMDALVRPDHTGTRSDLEPRASRQVLAQAPDAAAEGGDGEKGRPLDGYIGTAILVFLALFIVAKSARR